MAARALPLARALAQRGQRVRVILPPWDCPSDTGRTWEDCGVQVVNLSLPPSFPLWRHLALAWRLTREALADRPDIVHCFKPKAYAGLTGMALWYPARLSMIRPGLIMDTDDWEGKGGWNDLEDYGRLQRRIFAFQERWGLTHCHHVTVASRALETLAWSLGIPPARVTYLPNGANLDPSSPPQAAKVRRRHHLADHPVILLYTRFFEFNLRFPIAVMRRVVEAEPRARLLVVGKGLFGEERVFLDLARQAGLGDHVIPAGWVERSELPAYFGAAQVALYPYDDTLINRTKCSAKLVELMAAGVPVVASRVGQNGEYIQHGTSGRLVEAGDDAAMAAAVVELLRDQSLRQSLGEEARRRIAVGFTWDHLAERVERAYEEILSTEGPRMVAS